MKLIYTAASSDYYATKTGVLKVFKNLSVNESILIEMQLKLLKEKTSLSSFCMIPKTIIYDRDKVYGYKGNDYVIDDTLKIWCLKNKDNKAKLILMFKQISNYLKLIHQNKVVINDFSLNGIVISKENPYFIELDRAIVDGFDRFSLSNPNLHTSGFSEKSINNSINNDLENLAIWFLKLFDFDICDMPLSDIKSVMEINDFPSGFIKKTLNLMDPNTKSPIYLGDMIDDEVIKSLKLRY